MRFRSNSYILIILSLLSCSKNIEGDHHSFPDSSFRIEKVSDETDRAVNLADSVLNTMTLEERIGQCFIPSVSVLKEGNAIQSLQALIKDYHVGGVVIMDGNIASAKAIGEISARQEIPLIVAIDAEWGLGMRLDDAPVFPKNGKINKNLNEDILFDYGREIGTESRMLGINMVLGPVLDISSSSLGPIGNRSFGNNPEMVSDYAVAYSKGLESAGVISVAKHFPGHGSVLQDSHKNVGYVTKTISELDSTDLQPFISYINAGLSGVMAGHLNVRALTPEEVPAAVSFDILTNLLREEMNFKGLIITDAFNMGGAQGYSAADAFKAGADIVLFPSDLNWEIKNIVGQIRNGNFDERIINDRCRRILFTKALFRVGEEVKEKPENLLDIERASELIDSLS